MATVTASRLDPELAAQLQGSLPDALSGDELAGRRYARAWHELVREICSDHPEAPPSAAEVLDHLALTAPFEPGGALRALVSVATAIIPGMQAPALPRTRRTVRPASLEYERFARTVLAELGGAEPGLGRLMGSWGLTVTDVATLFGVRRQAVQQWLRGGVPAARRPKLLVISEVADLLERNLLPERIPGVVRTPGPAYDDRSMLEMIATERHHELLESVRRSFDWAWSA
jgi:hypothetical protein